MAKNKPKTTTTKSKPGTHTKPAPAPSKAKPGEVKPTIASPARRKIGERTEMITERLSLGQIEEERKKACELMRQKEQLDSTRKSTNADYKAKISDVETKMKACLSAAANGNRTVEIIVEEWLTDKNQVERYRADTKERIGDRVASVSELQETLPLANPNDDEDEDEDTEEKPHVDGPPPDDAEIIEATVKDSVDAGDDFGGA